MSTIINMLSRVTGKEDDFKFWREFTGFIVVIGNRQKIRWSRVISDSLLFQLAHIGSLKKFYMNSYLGFLLHGKKGGKWWREYLIQQLRPSMGMPTTFWKTTHIPTVGSMVLRLGLISCPSTPIIASSSWSSVGSYCFCMKTYGKRRMLQRISPFQSEITLAQLGRRLRRWAMNYLIIIPVRGGNHPLRSWRKDSVFLQTSI